MNKVECLNCGHKQNAAEKYVEVDNLGKHTVCEVCESSFDIE